MNRTNRISGFTLVELAIVMTIIGLIAGGIMAGQDLIAAATLKKSIRQLSDTETGVATFRNKYSNLPGDLPNPQSFFASGYVNASRSPGHGDGNGLIEGLASAASVSTSLSSAGETAVFYHQLYDAGYVKEPMTYVDLDPGTYNLAHATTNKGMFLSSALGRGVMIAPFSDATRNYLLIIGPATAPATNGAIAASGGLTPLQASNVDSKLDDGKPTTGNAISVNRTTPSATLDNGRPLATPTVDGVDCYDSTAGAYLAKHALPSCNLAVRTSF